MRILILTVGTRGDVQPYVALGSGLKAAGHEVSICTCEMFRTLIEAHGLSHAPMNNDIRDFMESDDGRRAMETTVNLVEVIRTGIRLMPRLRGMLQRQVDEMWAATESFNPDLILFHKKAMAAEDFAEKIGCRCALAFYLPVSVPTGEVPAFGFPRLPFGRWYNRLTYHAIETLTRVSSRRFVKSWRHSVGLTGRRASSSHHADGTPIAALHGFSPSVLRRPPDWPPHATVTGYWFSEPTTQYEPPEELVRFLADGDPPIYVGFGSIFGRDPESTTRRVIEGVHRSGCRAILASGWGGLSLTSCDLPQSMYAIEQVPHEWLFPQVAAVVHHGGCGTTAAGLRAGCPTVICPFFGDQPFWGRIVHKLGVGPKPVPQRKLTPGLLADAIKTAVSDSAIRSAASQLGRKIRSESGVQNAVDFIERLTRQVDATSSS